MSLLVCLLPPIALYALPCLELSALQSQPATWTRNELLGYHVTVVLVPPDQFFMPAASLDPSLDHLDPAILSSLPGANEPNLSDTAVQYLGYLDLATNATRENLIDDFTAETLKLLGFTKRGLVVSTRYAIPFTICGDSSRTAQTDVCVVHRPTMILLVIVDGKTFRNTTDAESEMIAGAIAAFQFNNSKREEKGLHRLDTMTIPAITMSGTRPTFYLVPVTQRLSDGVITGQYPADETRVKKCVTVATLTRRVNEGMENAGYRQLALRRFLAFKALAEHHWQIILEGYH